MKEDQKIQKLEEEKLDKVIGGLKAEVTIESSVPAKEDQEYINGLPQGDVIT